MRPFLFAVLALALFALKSTFQWQGSWFVLPAESFPQAVNSHSSSVLPLLLHRAAGDVASPALLGTSIAAVALAVLAFVTLVAPGPGLTSARRVALIAVLAWPGLNSPLAWLSNGQALLPLFVVLALFARSRLLIVLGVLGSVLTHPEQSMITFGLLTLLTISSSFRQFRFRAVAGLLAGLAATLVSTTWFMTSGVTARVDQIEVAGVSFRYFLRYGILGAYSWWGVWWLVVLAALALAHPKTRALILVAAVGVPALVVATTDNYTRVFTAVALAPGLALYARLQRNEATAANGSSDARTALGYWGLAFLLLPNVNLMMPGDAPAYPMNYWVGLVENYIGGVF